MTYDFSDLGLTTLVGVEFPPDVTELDCSYNRLRSLVGCPRLVKVLYFSDNQLQPPYNGNDPLEVLRQRHKASNKIQLLETENYQTKKITSVIEKTTQTDRTPLSREG